MHRKNILPVKPFDNIGSSGEYEEPAVTRLQRSFSLNAEMQTRVESMKISQTDGRGGKFITM